MKKTMFMIATCATALLAAPAAQAAVIAGPTLNANGSGWVYTGVQFQALQNATLTSFIYQNQGQADTVVLTDTSGNILQSVATTAGNLSQLVNVNWALSSGSSYRLLQTVVSNEKFASFGQPLPSNADIAITKSGLFSYTINDFSSFGANDYWAAFNDITTGSVNAAVPEPATWAMMLLGFGVVGGAMRRRQRVSVSFA